MTKEEFKKNIVKMTASQKRLFNKIQSDFVMELKPKDITNKTAYKEAMSKIYDKSVSEYVKRMKKIYGK